MGVGAQSTWVRVVRLAAAVAAIGVMAALPLVAFAAAAKAKEPEGPSYALSNLAAAAMCIVILAISCKRYHRA